MIAAHGATLNITDDSITVERSGLATALLGGATTEIPLAEVTGVELHEPTAFDVGWVVLTGADERLVFSPNQQDTARTFVHDVEAALRGEAPSPGQVTGLDFVALDVETANGAFGSICQVGVVRFRDGIAVEESVWLCRPPEGLDEFDDGNIAVHGITAEDVADSPRIGEILGEVRDFIGDEPIVAHNAQFDATALRDAARASGAKTFDDSPQLFGCSLALARHSRLDVKNHRLPTVSSFLGVELSRHHDALADAYAAGGIVAKLAGRSGHRGSLMDLFHAAGFTLGEIAQGSVTPVLRDRSGAGRTLQAEGRTSAAPQAAMRGEEDSATGAGTDFRDPTGAQTSEGDSESGSGGRRRGPAPWQSVATPDTIPEPNAAADPDDPLNGQHVTLTGDFEPYDKGRLWSGIAEHGGQVGKNVTKKTTILVTGTWATKTSKEKRAEELIEKGQDISIWSSEQLFAALELDEAPPF